MTRHCRYFQKPPLVGYWKGSNSKAAKRVMISAVCAIPMLSFIFDLPRVDWNEIARSLVQTGGGGSFGRAMTDEEQLPSDVRPDSYADNGEEWQWIESSNCTREKRLRNIPGIHITSMPFWIRLWQHQTRSRVGSRRPPRFLLRVAQETKKEPCKSVCARSL